MIIDTHCHYDFMPSPENYIAKCEKEKQIVIGMTNCPQHFEMGTSHIRSFKYVRLALGFHPQMVPLIKAQLPLFKDCVHKTSYIGEIGLDFSKEFESSKQEQVECLRYVLSLLQGKRKIISVHSRMAEKELFALLDEYKIENVIFHWYTGGLTLIPMILEKGYYFSINESMTQSANGKKIISRIPKDRILTETDAPYNRRCSITNALANMEMTENEVYDNFRTLIQRIR